MSLYGQVLFSNYFLILLNAVSEQGLSAVVCTFTTIWKLVINANQREELLFWGSFSRDSDPFCWGFSETKNLEDMFYLWCRTVQKYGLSSKAWTFWFWYFTVQLPLWKSSGLLGKRKTPGWPCKVSWCVRRSSILQHDTFYFANDWQTNITVPRVVSPYSRLADFFAHFRRNDLWTAGFAPAVFFLLKAVLRTLMRIRITLMWIRIQLPKVMRIRNIAWRLR